MYDGTILINTSIDDSGFKSGIKNIVNQTKDAGDAQKSVIRAVGTAALALSAAIAGAGVAAVKAGIEFESAFAGVRKTVDATEAQFDALEQGIRDMAQEIPATATEIANVAAAAGQLGIAQGDLLEFTETMVNLGVTTNLSSTDAATALARFANITGDVNFDKVGAAIVALGNNFATTEAEIVNMAQSMAGTGTTIGLSADQILAYAAAISSLGMEAEAGSTAFSRVISDMSLAVSKGGESLEQFSVIAGMSAEEFARVFREDANGAIIAFIEGLGKLNDEGGDIVGTLDEMGLADIRVSKLLQAAANSSDTFTKAIQLGSQAYKDNTALSKEAEQRYKTTQSQIQLLKNKATELALTFAEMLLPAVNKIVAGISKFVVWLKDNPEAITTFAIAVGALSAAFIAYNIVQTATTIAATGMAAAMWAALWPILAIVAAIALLAAGAVYASKALNEPVIASDNLADATMENGEKISEATAASVQAFLDLQDQSEQSLKMLQWSGKTITEEMCTEIVGNFEQMADLSIEAINRQKDESIAALQSMFINGTSLAGQQQTDILRLLEQGAANQISLVKTLEADYNAIILAGFEEARGYTEEEGARLVAIQRQLNDINISNTAQSVDEELAILRYGRDNAAALSAQQAADIVQKANETRDERIRIAGEELYDITLIAQQLREDGTAESNALADTLIADAQRQYDDTVRLAEEGHAAIITEAQLQAGEHVNLIDWETGEIKTKWQVFWDEVGLISQTAWGVVAGFFTGIWTTVTEIWSKIRDTIRTKIDETITSIKTFVSDAWKSVKDGWSDMVEAGKEWVAGIWKGISEKATWLWDQIKGFCGSIVDGVMNFFGINSPSRVMAEEVGRWIPPGITMGIELSADKELAKYKKFVDEFAEIGQAEILAGQQEVEQRFVYSGTQSAQPNTTVTNITNDVKIESGKALSESQLTDEMRDSQVRGEWEL